MTGARSPHDQTDQSQNQRKKTALQWAIAISSLTFVFQIFGAIYTGSLALLGDTAHLFTDLFSLAVSLVAVSLAIMPATHRRSFGLYRLEVLAAFLNGILLVIVAVGLAWESIDRLFHLSPVQALPLIAIAAAGMITNLLAALVLSRAMVPHQHLGHDHGCGHDHAPAPDHLHDHSHEHSHDHAHQHEPEHKHNDHAVPETHDRNLHGALLHVLSDALGSLAVVVGAIVVYFTNWQWVDPLLAIALAVMIMRWSVKLLMDSGHVLLEGTPRHLQCSEIVRELQKTDARVLAIEDLHVWEITSRMYACTAEVKMKDLPFAEADALRIKMYALLEKKFGINHAVLSLKL